MHQNIEFSALDMLYTAYTEQNPIDSQVMQDRFKELDVYLRPLSSEDQNAIFRVFCDIYTENERLAFEAGVRTGARLESELQND